MQEFNYIFNVLNTPLYSLYIFIGFVSLAALVLVFRLIVCINYKAVLAIFRINAKEMKVRTDIKDTGSHFLNKVVRDYIKIGDKGVSPRASKNIVDKHIGRLNFLGISYDALENVVMGIEKNIVFLGIILTLVFEDYRYTFAISTVAAFIVLRIFAALFDFTTIKHRTSLEISEYVDREIGQFYAGDSGTLMLRLKTELTESLNKQTENIGQSVLKMGMDLSNIMQLNLQEMSKAIDKTMLKISDFGGELGKPLEMWKTAIHETETAQNKFTQSLQAFEETAVKISSTSNNLSSSMGEYSEIINTQAKFVSEQISSLKEIAEGLKENSKPLMTIHDTLGSNLKYVEKNQELLETSLQRYETNMEQLVSKIGDGMGSIIDFHMQNSYKSMNQGLEDNIKKIVLANNELILRLQELFEQIHEQSRSETKAIRQVKEQMDIHFENLRGNKEYFMQ